jgi:hypothetical protein
MSKILRSAPFVAFPTGNGPTPSRELGLGPSMEFLGHSIAGDLYLNQDLVSVGLVCGGLVSVCFPFVSWIPPLRGSSCLTSDDC